MEQQYDVSLEKIKKLLLSGNLDDVVLGINLFGNKDICYLLNLETDSSFNLEDKTLFFVNICVNISTMITKIIYTNFQFPNYILWIGQTGIIYLTFKTEKQWNNYLKKKSLIQ